MQAFVQQGQFQETHVEVEGEVLRQELDQLSEVSDHSI